VGRGAFQDDPLRMTTSTLPDPPALAAKPAPQATAEAVPEMPPALAAALAAFARHERRTAMWRGWGETALVAAGVWVLGAANDAWLHPSYGGRCTVALGSAAVVAGFWAWRVLRPWWRGATPVAVARALETAAAARG
jgi:hypothetical protein